MLLKRNVQSLALHTDFYYKLLLASFENTLKLQGMFQFRLSYKQGMNEGRKPSFLKLTT